MGGMNDVPNRMERFSLNDIGITPPGKQPKAKPWNEGIPTVLPHPGVAAGNSSTNSIASSRNATNARSGPERGANTVHGVNEASREENSPKHKHKTQAQPESSEATKDATKKEATAACTYREQVRGLDTDVFRQTVNRRRLL